MKRGNNQQVINSWTCGTPMESYNGNLKTDGKNLFSYDMKIGTILNGQYLGLNVRGFSATTTKQLSGMHRVTGIQWVNPVRVENVKSVVLGWYNKITKTYWLFFPHEIEAILNGENE